MNLKKKTDVFLEDYDNGNDLKDLRQKYYNYKKKQKYIYKVKTDNILSKYTFETAFDIKIKFYNELFTK